MAKLVKYDHLTGSVEVLIRSTVDILKIRLAAEKNYIALVGKVTEESEMSLGVVIRDVSGKMIENTEDGYVVSVYYRMPDETVENWHRLRNFGDRQSDAIEFRNDDVPKLDDLQIRMLAKAYIKDCRYKRTVKNNRRIEFWKIKEL